MSRPRGWDQAPKKGVSGSFIVVADQDGKEDFGGCPTRGFPEEVWGETTGEAV